MPLVNMKDMLSHAYKHQYAIAAFDVVSLDFIAGIIAAAEAKQAPILCYLAPLFTSALSKSDLSAISYPSKHQFLTTNLCQ